MTLRLALLALASAAIIAAPAFGQPPAPPPSDGANPAAGAPDAQAQDFGRSRGFGGGRRQRGEFQAAPNGAGPPDGGFSGGGRGFGRFGPGGPQGPGGPDAPGTFPGGFGRFAPPRRASGPQPVPADAALMRDFEGSVSAVFDPGARTARVKLIETDSHGVEGLRVLKPGALYRDGWRLAAVTVREVTLRRGKKLLHVDITRGWMVRPVTLQAAVMIQPAPVATPVRRLTPQAANTGPGARRAGLPINGPAVNAGLGLSNARTGGTPQPVPAPVMPGPPRGGPVAISVSDQGDTTFIGPNGESFNLPPGAFPPPY